MKKIVGLLLVALSSPAFAVVTGTLSGLYNCNAGPWVELPDGNASVSAYGTFGGGEVHVKRLSANGNTAVEVPGAFWASDDGGGVTFSGGEKICMAMEGNPVNANVTWEIQPMYVRNKQSNALQLRY